MNLFDLCGTHASVLHAPYPLSLGSLIDTAYKGYTCTSGNLSALYAGASSWYLQPLWNSPMAGAGTDFDEDLARLKAVSETMERYCACVLLAHECRIASARELGVAAFDWSRLPRLSLDELSLPNQPFCNFDPDAAMRWIPAWSLNHERERLLPVSLTHLRPRQWTSERFCFPISTGLAAHTDPVRCMVGAIAEVIERDAIALTWLLRRPLTRISFDEADIRLLPGPLSPVLAQDEFRFYDAATDFGLPTVYLHRRRPAHPFAANLVTCAAAFDYAGAVANASREMASLCSIMDTGRLQPKADPMDCASIEEGAVYMSQPQRTAAFDFLGSSGRTVALRELVARQPAARSPQEQLAWLRERAREKDHDIFLSELTTDEASDAGLRVFRAVMPSLMPMTTDMRCRHLASQRLEAAHRQWGLPGSVASSLNPHPQPFA